MLLHRPASSQPPLSPSCRTTSDMTKVFCPHCGNKTLKKVAVSVSDDGSLHMHFSRNPKVLNPRGLRVSRCTGSAGQPLRDKSLAWGQLFLCSVLQRHAAISQSPLSRSRPRSEFNNPFCLGSTRCRPRRGGSTRTTLTWWKTSPSRSSGCPARPGRRPTSSTPTTSPGSRPLRKTTSTAVRPICRSGTRPWVLAGGA